MNSVTYSSIAQSGYFLLGILAVYLRFVVTKGMSCWPELISG
jgi:NADH:ubiquinone oxidoreductase subunit 2 (subunit N)